MQILHLDPTETHLVGEISIPGDKSITHRTYLLSSLAQGASHIKGFSKGLDCQHTLNALQQLGVKVSVLSDDEIIIHGEHLRIFHEPTLPLDMGNSGTAMRLFAGLLAPQPIAVTLIGDASLSKRPMQRVIEPLAQLGTQIQGALGGTPPIILQGHSALKKINYHMPIPSAQVKSCLLLAALQIPGQHCIFEPCKSRDHTERLLQYMEYPLTIDTLSLSLPGQAILQAKNISIPGDFSSAAFFMVAALINKHADIIIKNVGINPTRIGLLTVLKMMGAQIEVLHMRTVAGEPVADLHITPSVLHGVEVPRHLVTSMMDEFPVFFIAAATARGTTVVNAVAELRIKESDRLQVMNAALQTLGVTCELTPDGIMIHGQPHILFNGGTFHAHGDHRIAMALAIASLRVKEPMHIHDAAQINTSFPEFFHLAQQLGWDIIKGVH